MPPFLLSPVIATALTAVGAAVIARTLVKEWRRINAELEELATARAEAIDRRRLPTLRRDPRTGVYRPD